jgi:hypothetical protein
MPPEGIENTVFSLLDYCRKNDWAGYDPYDALNSPLIAGTPLANSKICRLILTQAMKRLPFNLRPLLRVPKKQNPKAIALFLSAFVKLSRRGLTGGADPVGVMAERLVAMRSQNTPYWCWGYSFPWQTRTLIVPPGAPNLVCTSFVANALLDAYEQNGESRYLAMAVSAGDYILNELYWVDENSNASLSYPVPSFRVRVHNANFLGAALLCRIYRHTGDNRYLEPALKVARYSAARQHDDGSWGYGESSTLQWVDNFHTGYNLCALQAVSRYAETSEFEPHVRRGFEYYRKHFFTDDGAPRYFHNRTYPIDIHSVAQSIITLLAFKDLHEQNAHLARSVYRWAMNHMWDERGYFYYQVYPFKTIRISYMRWSQAWMCLALSTLLEQGGQAEAAEPDGIRNRAITVA